MATLIGSDGSEVQKAHSGVEGKQLASLNNNFNPDTWSILSPLSEGLALTTGLTA